MTYFLVEPEKEEKLKSDAENVVPITQKKIDIKKEVKREIKAPTSDRFTIETPANLSLLDMDVIKLTAQFVARNGQKFLIALTEREKQNPQFDFLKPTHSLFSYFTNLVDAYSKAINPSKVEGIIIEFNS
jgi:splicing factor 3A subunit 1